MRRLAVIAQDRAGLHILLAQVAVGVTGHRDGRIRPDHLPDGPQDMMVGGAEAFHLAGAVEHQIDAVDLILMLPDCVHDQDSI